jgi:hypothetical protein
VEVEQVEFRSLLYLEHLVQLIQVVEVVVQVVLLGGKFCGRFSGGSGIVISKSTRIC